MDYRRHKALLTRRRAIAEVISVLPSNRLRCWLYRSLLGYDIRRSRIGWGTVIAVDRVSMEGALLSRYNKIVGPLELIMENRASIGSRNEVVCGRWAIDADHERFGYRRRIVIGENVLITDKVFFDVVDQIVIGSRTMIAREAQFWTHGFSGDERDVEIGADCYVAARCILTPGSGLAFGSIAGAGSVITRKHAQPYTLVSGNPAEVRRQGYYWRTRRAVGGEPAGPGASADTALEGGPQK